MEWRAAESDAMRSIITSFDINFDFRPDPSVKLKGLNVGGQVEYSSDLVTKNGSVNNANGAPSVGSIYDSQFKLTGEFSPVGDIASLKVDAVYHNFHTNFSDTLGRDSNYNNYLSPPNASFEVMGTTIVDTNGKVMGYDQVNRSYDILSVKIAGIGFDFKFDINEYESKLDVLFDKYSDSNSDATSSDALGKYYKPIP